MLAQLVNYSKPAIRSRNFATVLTGFEAKFDRLKQEALEGGGKQRNEVQHSKGKLTARERIDLLLDKGSFIECKSSSFK